MEIVESPEHQTGEVDEIAEQLDETTGPPEPAAIETVESPEHYAGEFDETVELLDETTEPPEAGAIFEAIVDDWSADLDPSDEDQFVVEDGALTEEEGVHIGPEPAAVEELLHKVLEALSSVGLINERLALQQGDESMLLTQALRELQITTSYEMRGLLLSRLYQEVEKAVSMQPLLKRSRMEFSTPGKARSHDVMQALNTASASSSSKGLPSDEGWIPKKGLRKTRSGQLTSAGTIPTRVDRDKAQLEHCQATLIELMTEAATPSYRQALTSAEPLRTLAGLLGKTRPSTAGPYLRRWEAFRSWLLSTKSLAWPGEVGHIIDYMYMLEGKPCKPSVPQALMQAIHWMYGCAGFKGEHDLSNNMFLRRTVDRLTVSLAGGGIEKWQAPRFPVLILAALEIYVLNEKVPPFKRIHGGSMLFRSWATLRFDDIQRIHRKRLQFHGNVLQTELLSSKTSGPGKRVRQLPIAVTVEAQLLKSGWLRKFVELLREHLPAEVDYLLEKPTGDFQRTTGAILKYSQSAAMTTLVIRELRVPFRDVDGWKASDVEVVPAAFEDLFTEHSGRPVVPSGAIMVEDSKSKRDMIGRWCPDGSDDYSRTHRAVVVGIQTKVAQAFMQGQGSTTLHESDVVDRARRHLTERRGYTDRQAEEICTKWHAKLEGFSTLLGRECAASIEMSQASLQSEPLGVPIQELPAGEALQKAQLKRIVQSKFTVTYNRNKTVARLHKTCNGCHWASRQLIDSREVNRIDATMYDKRCKFCWPELLKKADTEETGSSTESSSSSDDSD